MENKIEVGQRRRLNCPQNQIAHGKVVVVKSIDPRAAVLHLQVFCEYEEGGPCRFSIEWGEQFTDLVPAEVVPGAGVKKARPRTNQTRSRVLVVVPAAWLNASNTNADRAKAVTAALHRAGLRRWSATPQGDLERDGWFFKNDHVAAIVEARPAVLDYKFVAYNTLDTTRDRHFFVQIGALTAASVLEGARAVIDQLGWTTRRFRAGNCFCASGALRDSSEYCETSEPYAQARRALIDAARARGRHSIVDLNDNGTRDVVLKTFTAAIAIAQARD